ncbi:hypothetical protein GLOIN_2v1478488 [Rhizophagus irregularis DAOM 181602=DAOM 197198]|nr:hypothetical protein GLOIN_2v1478488 [Rhizophagus irregularis DAOM 181602=DAOM 197198]
MDFTSRKQFPILYDVLDGKMKHVAEQGKANVQGADGLSVEECKKILYSPVLNIDTPTGLLKKVFFLNALFLALRGGNADKEFYLREYVSEDDYIIYNRWFQKFHIMIKWKARMF